MVQFRLVTDTEVSWAVLEPVTRAFLRRKWRRSRSEGLRRKFVLQSDSVWLQAEQQREREREREMWLRSVVLSIALSCCCAAQGNLRDHQPVALTMGAARSPDQSVAQAAGPSPVLSRTQPVQNDPEEDIWKTKVLNLLTRLVGIQAEVAKQQAQVVQQLEILGNQGSQQVQDLQNLARHQNLLVENHQALLLQTSRIATELQQINRKPAAAGQ